MYSIFIMNRFSWCKFINMIFFILLFVIRHVLERTFSNIVYYKYLNSYSTLLKMIVFKNDASSLPLNQLWPFVNSALQPRHWNWNWNWNWNWYYKHHYLDFQGLWTPKLLGSGRRMRRSHPQSNKTLWYRGHVRNKKRYISTFTRPVYLKLRRVVT